MYDAIIVGARVAGAPTAMLLARHGYKVLLLDKSAFPSDIMSTHYIQQHGVARLRRWGLLDQVRASDCPPSLDWRFDVGPFALHGNPPAADEGGVEYCPRRFVLDDILVKAAVQASAELRERFTVQEILSDGQRVTGIRGRVAGGATVTEQARVVIGADGLRSFVARSVQAPTYDSHPGRTCAYYTYFSGVPVTGVEIYPRPGRAIVVMRTNHDQACIGVQW